MNKKTIALSLTAAFASAAITAGVTSAYHGDPNVHGPNYTPERHEAMEQAFENKDFEAWKKLHNGRGRISQVIDSQEKFEKFAKARQLMLAGKTDEANSIRSELGLGNGHGWHGNSHHNQ